MHSTFYHRCSNCLVYAFQTFRTFNNVSFTIKNHEEIPRYRSHNCNISFNNRLWRNLGNHDLLQRVKPREKPVFCNYNKPHESISKFQIFPKRQSKTQHLIKESHFISIKQLRSHHWSWRETVQQHRGELPTKVVEKKQTQVTKRTRTWIRGHTCAGRD